MTVREMKTLLAGLPDDADDLQIVVPGDAREDEAEERAIADVVTRESMFGEGRVVAIVREEAWD